MSLADYSLQILSLSLQLSQCCFIWHDQGFSSVRTGQDVRQKLKEKGTE